MVPEHLVSTPHTHQHTHTCLTPSCRRCKYIQKYMIQVMMALRKLVGIVGAGFEMLQDFIDEIFQGILPASFVAKYAEKAFQAGMEARYSEPTSHNSRGRARNHVPTSANMRPISRVSNKKNKAAGIAGMVLTGLSTVTGGKLATAIDVVSGVWDLVNMAQQMEADRILEEMWPENFTLFGYDGVVNMFDDMESFLLEDSSCYRLELYEKANKTYQMFTCLKLDIRRYQKTTRGTTAIDATQCWADATPSIGQNSLFACTTGSTCCETTACDKRITCGACPSQALEGTNQYGCEGALRKCVCGTPKTEVSKCASNMQCDVGEQCELVSSMNSVSYGTIPCRLCPSESQVLCLLKPRGMPGACVCMLTTQVKFDVCNDMSGMETGVDSAKLCGYMHGQTTRAPAQAFDMDNIMVVPCSMVYTGVCATVYNTGFSRSTIRMVVAVRIRAGTSAAGGRRLLMEEDVVPEPGPPVHHDAYESDYELLNSEALHELLMAPGWNTTSAPCSTLAMAYQDAAGGGHPPMGILETHELHKCGFWRFVGRRVLARHNLSATDPLQRHDTFLLSIDDLLFALMSTDGAGMTLMRNPTLFGSALLYHPWMKPLRALGVLLANQLEHIKWIRDIDIDVHDPLFGDSAPKKQALRRLIRRTAQAQRPLKPNATGRLTSAQAPRPLKPNATGRGRRLLSVVNTVKDVEQYSRQIIEAAPNARGSVPARVAGAWSTSSFVWPPVYDYSLEACPLALSLLHMGRQVVAVNVLYFQGFHKEHPIAINRSLRANLPSWSWIGTIQPLGTASALANKTRSWASTAFHWVMDLTGIRPSHLVAFFKSDQKWSLQWILETSIKCDLASVLTCSRHDKDLVMSSVIFILGYLAVNTVCGALGVGFLSVVYALSYPWFILWYVFGMGPSCFPMVPTCLLSDIIATAEILVPPAILFPPNLLCDPTEKALNQSCLRQCTELNFNGWEDPLAFAVCDTDAVTCRYVHTSLPRTTGWGLLDTLLWTPLHDALGRSDTLVTTTEPSHLAGYRLCTWVSFITTVPILALAGAALVLASAVCFAALDLIPPALAFTAQLYVFYTAKR